MATNLYVAEDGTIHRSPVTAVNNGANRNNTFNRSGSSVRTQHMEESCVSEERAVWFWIVSIVLSVLVGLAVNACLGASFTDTSGDFASVITPYVVMIGSLAGTILYGIFCAKKVDYNMWAYILGALSALGGIAAAFIAAIVICIVVAIGLVILGIALVIGICSEL